jgi:PHD/YefM family antitoxin component YafN of YafNO toxin-antitoxin module
VIIIAKTVSLKEAQATYSLSLDKTDLAQGPLILEHEGEPVAAVVPIAEYREFETWQEREAKTRPEPDEAFERERAAFERLKPELLKTHKGQFVAIHKGEVVDADTDNRELAKRIYARKLFPVYIQLVSKQPRVIELPSPEEVRRVPL